MNLCATACVGALSLVGVVAAPLGPVTATTPPRNPTSLPANGHYGLPATVGRFGLHEMTVPAVPRQRHLRRLCGQASPSAFLRNGNLAEYCSFEVAIRYDPNRHRFLRGLAPVGSDTGIASAGRGQSIWNEGGRMEETWVYHEGFALQGVKRPRPWRFVHGQSNGVAVDSAGNAWVAGWRVSNDYWGDWINPTIRKHYAKGLPTSVPKGWAAIFVMSPKTGVARVIHASASGPLTGIAIFKNFVWTIDPYRRCRHRGRVWHCKAPELLQYNRATRRFDTYKIPRGFHLRPTNDVYYRTPMTVGPDDSVWTVLLGTPENQNRSGANTKRGRARLTLLGFHDGRFLSFPLWRLGRDYYFSDSTAPTPLVDSAGRIWLQGSHGHPIVIDPNTGRMTVLKPKDGNLLQDSRRTLWYVSASGSA